MTTELLMFCCISRELGSLFFRGRFRFGYGVFRVPKNGIFKTNKSCVIWLVKIVLTLSKKILKLKNVGSPTIY